MIVEWIFVCFCRIDVVEIVSLKSNEIERFLLFAIKVRMVYQ